MLFFALLSKKTLNNKEITDLIVGPINNSHFAGITLLQTEHVYHDKKKLESVIPTSPHSKVNFALSFHYDTSKHLN